MLKGYLKELLVLWITISTTIFTYGSSPTMKRICIGTDGTVSIFWNKYSDTCAVNSLKLYGREDQFSSYKVINSFSDFTSNSFYQSNAASFTRGQYFVKYTVDCGKGAVDIYSDTMDVDIIRPNAIDPDSVSVLPDGTVVIGWTPESSKDVKSYVIYRYDGTSNFLLGQSLGKFNTQFVDNISGQATQRSVRYRIAAVDSCENIAAIGGFNETMFLQVSADTCRGAIILNWTPYQGWNKVNNYEIFYSVNNSGVYLSAGTTKSTTFDFLKGQPGSTYQFFVRAYKDASSFTSSSNRVSIFADFSLPVNYVYLKSVDVSDEHVVLNWEVSGNKSVSYYEIWRGLSPGKLYFLDKIPSTFLYEYSYRDNSFNVSSQVFFYQVRAINHCGRNVGNTNVSNNILLQYSNSEDTRLLSWSPYTSWEGGLQKYIIYRSRSLSEDPQWEQIGETDNLTTVFSDSDTTSNYGSKGLCYKVTAIEGDTDKYGFKEQANSNIVCYIEEPVIHIPNAFVPVYGSNLIFKPVILFADTVISRMIIYNRWGEELNETTISRGWNGLMKNGELAPPGIYFYVIFLHGFDLSDRVLKGTFSLL